MAKILDKELKSVNAGTPVYAGTPTLSKVKLSDGSYYFLKDADARKVIDEIYADYLKSTDKEALQSAIDTKVAQTDYNTKVKELEDADTAIKARIKAIEDDYLKAADKTALETAIGKKVDKVEGKSLVSDTEITKLEGVSAGANKVEATAKSGKISIDGTEVQIVADNTVVDDNYKHITVTESSVSDGTTTFNKYDDTALAERVTTAEGNITTNTEAIAAETLRATGVEGGLETRIENLEARGRFLSGWNAGTGKPSDYPTVPSGATYPYDYAYKAGDYYIVSAVPTTGNKYQPSGTKITKPSAAEEWTVGTTAETREVAIGDYYVYSTTGWILVSNSQKTVSFENIAGEARDNTSLDTEFTAVETALGTKVDKVTGSSLVPDTKVTAYDAHIANADIHVTAEQKAAWTAKQDALTEAQLAAVNSGIDSTKVAQIATNTTGITNLAAALGTEIEDRKAKDTELQDNIDSEASRAGLVESGLRTDVDANAASITTLNTNKVDKTQKVAGLALSGDIATADLQTALGLEDLAYSDTASGSLETIDSISASASVPVSVSGTISSTPTAITSTGSTTAAGSVSVMLNGSYESIASSGSYTPSGIVTVSLSGGDFNVVSSVGTLPSLIPASLTGGKATVVDTTKFNGGTAASFTYGAFTANVPTKIDTTKFNGGSAATWTGATYTAPSLGAASTAKFAKKALKMEVGTGADAECLIFTDVADTDTTYFASAATDNGTFNAGNVGFGTFNGGSAASLSDGFYTAGTAASKVEDTFVANTVASLDSGFVTAGTDVDYTAASFDAGMLPSLTSHNVGVQNADFSGTMGTVDVTGSYHNVTSATADFTGSSSIVEVTGSYDKASGSISAEGTATVTIPSESFTLNKTAKTITVTPDA